MSLAPATPALAALFSNMHEHREGTVCMRKQIHSLLVRVPAARCDRGVILPASKFHLAVSNVVTARVPDARRTVSK